MATTQEEFFVDFADLTGGRNGHLPPHEIAMNECVDAVNITWTFTRFATKRNGMAIAPLTANPFDGDIYGLFRHVPGNDETKAELWAVGLNGSTHLFGRLAGGTTWQTVTPSDPCINPGSDVSCATFQGKLFIAYNNAANRLHCWDGAALRRVGLNPCAPPAVSTSSTGPAIATPRWYKASFVTISGSDTQRRSELSTAVAFTPPAGNGVGIFRPALLGEGETHWEVWASEDNADFYRLAQLPLATLSLQDSAEPSTYPTAGPLAPDVGENLAPEAWKFLTVHENRLLGAGTWATTNAKHNRVWFTPQTGDSDVGDDERVPNTTGRKFWIDVNERDGDVITGLASAAGVVYVFKRRGIYKLVPTGNANAPYVVSEVISGGCGCISFRTIQVGEDDAGAPALYFCSQRGLFRIGPAGIQYCSRGIEDLWPGLNLTPQAYGSVYPTLQLFGLWYEAKAQYWLFAAVRGESTGTVTISVLHVRYAHLLPEGIRGGWTRFTFRNQDQGTDAAVMRAACLFSTTIGASMSLQLQPYLTYENGGAGTIVRADDPASTTDVGAPFAGAVRLAEKAFAGYGRRFAVRKAFVVGATAESRGLSPTLALQIRYSIDFGRSVRTALWQLSRAEAGTAQERRIWFVEEAEAADCGTVEIRIGDAVAAATGSWQLEGARFLLQAQQVP